MESTLHTTRHKKRSVFITLGILFGITGIHFLYIGRTNRFLFRLLILCFLYWTIIVPLILWMLSIREALTIMEDIDGNPLR